MKELHRLIIFGLLGFYLEQADGAPFETVQFRRTATSFSKRTDQFIVRGPKEISDYFSIDLPPIRDFPLWSPEPHYFGSFNVHFTPDFSNGLGYPDPFLLTGPEAKRLASYLYGKQLFFHDIPHVRAVKLNQKQRIDNGLPPHKLGSLSLRSPWYRL